MEKAILTVIFLAALGVILALQYRSGYIHIQSKTALMYRGSVGAKYAAFTSCSGYTKRVVRFKESGTVRFTFQPELSAGSVIVEVLDKKKQKLCRLSSVNPTVELQVERKQMYYLVIRFQSATGSYQLNWDGGSE